MLSIRHLRKSFESQSEPVLRDLSFEMAAGDFCVVIGSNGSGKSTLLKSISGEYRPDSGSICFNGQDITAQSLSERARFISCVTQDVTRGTVAEMTLLENMVLSQMRGQKSGLSFYAQRAPAIRAIVEELELGLEQYLDKPLSVLSGGQRQSMATVMALMSKPQMVLLDEHTSALDPKAQRLLMAYTATKIQADKMSALLITHNLEDAVRYGNRLIMLHRGQIVFEVSGADKAKLTLQEALDLFHSYEDQVLASANGDA